MKYSPIIKEKNENNANGKIILGQTYEGFFQSKNNNDAVQKNHELSVSENGTYTFAISSDMTLDYSIKDIDENVIGEGCLYADSNSKLEFVLTVGTYDIVCKTSEAGSYQLLVGEKEVEANKEEDNVISQDEQNVKEEDKVNNIDRSNIAEKIFSPSTFIGAILVTVIGGVIVSLITKNRN